MSNKVRAIPEGILQSLITQARLNGTMPDDVRKAQSILYEHDGTIAESLFNELMDIINQTNPEDELERWCNNAVKTGRFIV